MIEGAPNDDVKMQQQFSEEPNFHNQPSISPSFSSYSSETLAEIAARVISELRFDPQNDDESLFHTWEEDEQNDNHHPNDDNVKDDDQEFSFALVLRDANTSPVSADDIFCNGQIRPMYMYPLFGSTTSNNNAPLNDAVSPTVPNNSRQNDTVRRRLPLRKLMSEERETGSCSSSEADESVDLEGVQEGTYCVWNPNAVARDRKKSNSTGSSSKRWKLREILLRSLSEGKGKKNSSSSSNSNDGGDNDIDNDGDNKKRAFVFGVPEKRTSKVAAAKTAYGGASVERQGKKSVLPYKQEFVGIFANVNGLGRNLHPF